MIKIIPIMLVCADDVKDIVASPFPMIPNCKPLKRGNPLGINWRRNDKDPMCFAVAALEALFQIQSFMDSLVKVSRSALEPDGPRNSFIDIMWKAVHEGYALEPHDSPQVPSDSTISLYQLVSELADKFKELPENEGLSQCSADEFVSWICDHSVSHVNPIEFGPNDKDRVLKRARGLAKSASSPSHLTVSRMGSRKEAPIGPFGRWVLLHERPCCGTGNVDSQIISAKVSVPLKSSTNKSVADLLNSDEPPPGTDMCPTERCKRNKQLHRVVTTHYIVKSNILRIAVTRVNKGQKLRVPMKMWYSAPQGADDEDSAKCYVLRSAILHDLPYAQAGNSTRGHYTALVSRYDEVGKHMNWFELNYPKRRLYRSNTREMDEVDKLLSTRGQVLFYELDASQSGQRKNDTWWEETKTSEIAVTSMGLRSRDNQTEHVGENHWGVVELAVYLKSFILIKYKIYVLQVTGLDDNTQSCDGSGGKRHRDEENGKDKGNATSASHEGGDVDVEHDGGDPRGDDGNQLGHGARAKRARTNVTSAVHEAERAETEATDEADAVVGRFHYVRFVIGGGGGDHW
jgi:hypothetical protein